MRLTRRSRAFYYCASDLLPPGVYNTEGNVAGDPLFVNATLGDVRLLEGSPCINAGTNMPWMASAADLDGNARVHDECVDIGCYEYIPEPAGVLLLALTALLRLPGNRSYRTNRTHEL